MTSRPSLPPVQQYLSSKVVYSSPSHTTTMSESVTLVYGSDDDLDAFPDRDVDVSPQHDFIAGPDVTRTTPLSDPPLNGSSEITQSQKASKRSKSIDKQGNGGAQRKDSQNGSVGNDTTRKRSSGSLSKIKRNSKSNSRQDTDLRRGSSSSVNKRSSSLEKNVAAGKSRSNSSGGSARVPVKASMSCPSHESEVVGTAIGPNLEEDLELQIMSEGYVNFWPAERTRSDTGTLPRHDTTSVHSHSSGRHAQLHDIDTVYDVPEDGLWLQEKDSGLETSRNFSVPLEDLQPQSDYYVSRDDFHGSMPQDEVPHGHPPTCFQVGMTEAQQKHDGSSVTREGDRPASEQEHRLSTESQRLARHNQLPQFSVPSLLSLPIVEGVLAEDKLLFQTGAQDTHEPPLARTNDQRNMSVGSGPCTDPGQARFVNERMDQIQKQLGDIYHTMDQFLQGVGREDAGARTGVDASQGISSPFVHSHTPQHDPAALMAHGKDWSSQFMADTEPRQRLAVMNNMQPLCMADMFTKPTQQRTFLPASSHQSRLPGTFESTPNGYPSVSSRVPCWSSYRMPQADTPEEHEETARAVPLWPAHTSKSATQTTRMPCRLEARVSKFTESPENVRSTATAHPQVPTLPRVDPVVC